MSLWKLPVPIVGALLLATLSNVPGNYHLGGFTLSAVLTAAECFIALLVLPRLMGRRVDALMPFGLFLLWVVFEGIFQGMTYDGFQNVTVFVMFALVVWVSAVFGKQHREAIYVWMLRLGWLVAVLFAASTVVEGVGAQSLFSARVFGIQALFFMAMAVPMPTRSWWGRAFPWVMFVLVSASLSRTATAIAAVMLVIRAAHTRRGRRLWRSIAAASVGALICGWAVLNVGVLNDRVFGGDASLSIGGVHFNGTGRLAIWDELIDDIHGWHVTGFGPGAASTELIRRHTGQAEPHNDYLRVFYDYGLIGIGLFAWGLLRPLRNVLMSAARTKDPSAAARHTIAALSFLALLGLMLTDNVLIYSWAMAPAAVLIGLSLAREDPEGGADPDPAAIGGEAARARVRPA